MAMTIILDFVFISSVSGRCIRKLIAYTAYRVEINRMFLVGLKVLSECQNEVVYRPCRRIYIVVPYRLQDLFAGNGLVLPFDQQFKQHGFLLRQRCYRSISMMQLIGVEIDGLISNSIRVELF